jgi:hypothetical protein
MTQLGTNTLYYEITCPHCGEQVMSGIGFRAGAIKRQSYKLGDKLTWKAKGALIRPEKRPPKGNLKTIGYFNCDNLRCSTWQDCFPIVQEALITISGDKIAEVEPTTHRPDDLTFDILEPQGLT